MVESSSNTWSGSTVRLLFLEQAKLGNLHTRAEEFAIRTGANVAITQVSIADWQKEVFSDAGRGGPRNFDGYSVKGNWIPSLVEDGGLADLSGLIEDENLWTDLQWTDIVSVVRNSICVYNGTTYSIPVDADYIVTVARDDLFNIKNNIFDPSTTLNTWEEWVTFAETHHGQDLNGDGISDYGACMAKGEGVTHFSVFANLWAIVAPHLQFDGRTAGSFFNTTTFQPLWSSSDGDDDRQIEITKSFHRALELYKRLIAVTKQGEVNAIQAKKLFQSGRCATWMSLPGFVFGVQDTGGIKAANLTTATMKRFPSPGVVCTSKEECPFAVTVSGRSGVAEDTRLINRVPFFATSGAGLVVSSSATNETQQLLSEIFTYISAPTQSNSDVTLRSSFSDPFRNSQLGDHATDRLVSQGWDRSDAESYHEVVMQTLNDDGAALDLRVPSARLYQSSTLQAIDQYVYGDNLTITAADAASEIAAAWDAIPSEIYPSLETDAAKMMMRDIYRAQLGLRPIANNPGATIIGGNNGNSLTVILVPCIIFAVCILAAIIAYLFVEKRRKSGDSVWAVKREELTFADPPTVIGRGTFGLVLLAEYRGTEVAVKRVIPPRLIHPKSKNNDDKNNGSPSVVRRNSILGKGDPEVKERIDNIVKQAKLEMRAHFDYSNSKLDVWDEDPGMQSGSSVVIRSGTNSGTFTNSLTTSISGMDSSHSKTKNGSFRKRVLAKIRRQNDYDLLKEDFIVEMRHLSKLRHPCVTTVMGAVIEKSQEPMLVMEYMDYGSLYDILHNDTFSLDGSLLLPILRDVAQGARFLHAADPLVVHGDIKAQNILVDSKFRAKVADFGLSQKKEVGATGTPLWMAPELLRNDSGNTAASDVYSFGIILYEVYSRKAPFEGERLSEVLKGVADPKINKRPPVPPAMPPSVSDMMRDCLDADPQARPTFEDLDKRLKQLNAECVEPGDSYTSKLQLAENLLKNVFPPHIADALRDGRKVEQENHECVTIFFSDIVGFTTISQSITPQKVCEMLDRLYQRFDDLSHKHDVFKVETIGDAYMAITNLVKKQKCDHVKRMAEFSKDVIQAASETRIDEDDYSKGYVEIRVGFHSGPVIADVIGKRLPKYGVFGDAVNTASRMESNSETGRIHCSEISANLLMTQDPEMTIVSRGNIRIKGKGEMHTYWVGEELVTDSAP